MGGDIIPRLVRDGAVHVYDFLQNEVPGTGGQDHGYWREVGTLDSYFEAHMFPVFLLQEMFGREYFVASFPDRPAQLDEVPPEART